MRSNLIKIMCGGLFAAVLFTSASSGGSVDKTDSPQRAIGLEEDGRLQVRAKPVGASAGLESGVRGGAVTGKKRSTRPAWLQRIQKSIQESEYHVTFQEKTCLPDLTDAYHAANRANGLRFYFTAEGLRVVSRKEKNPTWNAGLELVALKRGEDYLRLPRDGKPSVNHGRIAFNRGLLTEWYENRSEGLEQGFTIEERIEGSGELLLSLRVEGDVTPRLSEDHDTVQFLKPNKAPLFRYGGLKAKDAAGKDLDCRMSLDGNSLNIIVSDRDAVYPVTVDPLITAPGWWTESGQAGSMYGLSVASAGDVNGDGYPDVAVGAPGYDNGQTDEGRVFVFYGSEFGPSLVPDWTAESDQGGSQFGVVASAGDVNGDGYADLMIGAPGYSNGHPLEGAVFVFHGSSTGLNPPTGTRPTVDPSNADWSAEGNAPDSGFGGSLSSAGDLDKDGYGDIVVGAYRYTNGQSHEGAAFVFKGSASGLDPGGRLVGSPSNTDWVAEGNQANAFFGVSVAGCGDFDNNGYPDILVGAHYYTNGENQEGALFAYRFSAGFTSTLGVVESNIADSHFGVSVAFAGDVNGDTYDDVIVGAHAYTGGESNEGAAFLYYGSSSGNLTLAWTGESNQAGANFGIAVSGVTDLNGDGFADVMVGADSFSNGQTKEGAVFIYYGSSAGLGAAGNPDNADWRMEGDVAYARFGCSLAPAGDVNGDGHEDILVGAYEYDPTTPLIDNQGSAFVFYGSSVGPDDDGDGLTDYEEVVLGTDPFDWDTDSDLADDLSDELPLDGTVTTEADHEEVSLLTGSNTLQFPDIWGTRVVCGDYSEQEIYFHDFSTGETLNVTDNTFGECCPRICGDRIVYSGIRLYEGGGGSSNDICMYDLLTGEEKRICSDPSIQDSPDISGDRIVWRDKRNGNWDIYLFDLERGVEIPITTDTAEQGYPAISGDRIVWEDNRNGNWDIYMYDMGSGVTTLVNDNLSNQRSPDISGDLIVWQDDRNGNTEIYLYDISTTALRNITLDASAQASPRISGGRIVWTDWRNGGLDVYSYDLSTETVTRITTDSSHQSQPAVFGGSIVWVDDRSEGVGPGIYGFIADGVGLGDNCPGIFNPGQEDVDTDGLGDACDDSDGDGLTDARELALGTDYDDEDSDGDGLSDGDEVNTYSTDPLDPDTDGDGINDGDEVANGTNPNSAYTPVSANITSDTTWDLYGSPYVVQTNIYVDTGATLTIDPGVVVKFQDGMSMEIYGTLAADGTAGTIYFTSIKDDTVGGDTNGDGGASSPARGDWGWLWFYDSTGNMFTNVVARYGGGGWAAMVNLEHYSSIIVEDSLFELSSSDALRLMYSDAAISGSTIRDNGGSGLYVYDNPTTVTITGSTVTGNQNHGIQVDISTAVIDLCNISGNGLNGIRADNSTVSITGNTVSGNGEYGIYGDDSVPTITGNTITGHMTHGPIYLDGDSLRDGTFSANNLSGNILDTNVIGGTLDEDATWSSAYGTYVVEDLTVASGVTLAIGSNTVVKFRSGDMTVEGAVEADGTAGTIYFTSIKDDTVGGDTNGDGDASSPASGDWGWLWFYNSTGNMFTNVVVRYGGGGWAAMVNLEHYSSIIIEDSLFEFSSSDALRIMYSSAGISGSTIWGNGGSGVYTYGDPNILNFVWITGSTVTGNQNYGIQIDTSIMAGIDSCTISGNGLNGIRADNSSVSITGNTITGHTTHGPIYLDGDSLRDGTLSDNDLSGNLFDAPVIGGTLDEDAAWSSAHGTYVVEGLTVASGVTLTIQPGVVVKVPEAQWMDIYGTLAADGTSGTIYFTSTKDDTVGGDTNGDGGASSPAHGDWRRLWFWGSAGSVLRNVTVRYGGDAGPMVDVDSSSITIEDSLFESSSTDCLKLKGSVVAISDTLIRDALYFGLYIDDNPETVTITGSTFSENDRGLHIEDSAVAIDSCLISDNGEKGIYVSGETSQLSIRKCILSNQTYGVYSTGGAEPVVGGSETEANSFSGNGYGVLNDDSSVTVNAEYNYWGDPSGPTHPSNPDGSGEAVSDDVDFDPWVSVPDVDNDGLPDSVETDTGTFADSNDTGTDPFNPDTDGDGLLDGVETNTGVLVDRNDTGTNPNIFDSDGDGLSDGDEVNIYGTDPTAGSDLSLLVNPGFEADLTGWTTPCGAIRTVSPLPHGGAKYLTGGTVADCYAYQTVDLVARGLDAGAIDAGLYALNYGGWQSGWGTQTDSGLIEIILKDADSSELARHDLGWFYSNSTWLLNNGIVALLPGTRYVTYGFHAHRTLGTNNDAYLDDAFLIVSETVDTDGDGDPDITDPDDDNDGLSDDVETNTGIFVDLNDTGTDPLNPDTDGDHLDDRYEVEDLGTDPNDPADGHIPMWGAVHHLIESGGSKTALHVFVDEAYLGPLPGDVTIEVLDPSNQTVPATFSYDPQWRLFYSEVNGAPDLGRYTFIAGSGSIEGIATDVQATNRAIPVPAPSGYSPDESVSTPGFEWDAFDYAGQSLYYRIQVRPQSGAAWYQSPREKDTTSWTLPHGFCVPGETYLWRINAFDDSDFQKAQNRVNTDWREFTMAPALTHPSPPVIDPDGGVMTYTMPDNDLLVFSVKIIDQDGVASDGSSHTVHVTGPGVDHQMSYDSSNRRRHLRTTTSGFYSYSMPVVITPEAGDYVFTVTDPDGNPSTYTETLAASDINPVDPPPDLTTLSPSSQGEHVTMHVDNVEVNGAPYDNFDSYADISELDPLKWSNDCGGGSISGGSLVLEHQETIGGSDCGVSFVDPEGIHSIKADITVPSISSNLARGRIGGWFFNNGNGDVFAEVSVRQNVVRWQVLEFPRSDLRASNYLIYQDLMGVTPGQTIRASIAWDEVNKRLTVSAENLTTLEGVGSLYEPSAAYPLVRDTWKGISTRTILFVEDTTPTFTIAPVAGASSLTIRIYDVWSDYVIWNSPFDPTAGSITVPPGVLEPNTIYTAEIRGAREHSPLDLDNYSRAPSQPFEFSTGDQDNIPFISLERHGVTTWTQEDSPGPFTVFHVTVHDAQGVPGDIDSVAVTFPDSTTVVDLEPAVGSPFAKFTETSATYQGIFEGPVQAGEYTFSVRDNSGSPVSSVTETLTNDPVGYPARASLSPAHNTLHDPAGGNVPFDWDDVPDIGPEAGGGVGFYRVEIFDYDVNPVYQFATTQSQISVPVGFFSENTLYRYRISTRREYYDQNVDNGSASPPGYGSLLTFVVTSQTASLDGDAIPDGWEIAYGLDAEADNTSTDFDADGLLDPDEYVRGTDPTVADTDGDGMPDGWEADYGLDPLDPSDAAGDDDGDGLSALEEYQNNSDPGDSDSDGDGLLDGDEVLVYSTDPSDPDSDDDGVVDGLEIATDTDPNDPASHLTYVSGGISSDTTWTIAGNPYLVTGDTFIDPGVTVDIEAGVIVKFQPNADMTVYGTMNAVGSAGNEIYFTSIDDHSRGGDTGDGVPAPGDWRGVRFQGDFSNQGHGTLSHCVFRYGGEHYTGPSDPFTVVFIYGTNASVAMDDCTVEQSSHTGVYVKFVPSGGASVSHCSFLNNTEWGVYHQTSAVHLTDNEFSGNGSGAAALFGDLGEITLSGNGISGNNGGRNGITVAGTVSSDHTWPADNGFPYIVDRTNLNDTVTVLPGATLTLSPGVVVKFPTTTPTHAFNILGRLDAQGTGTDRIYFTSLNDDSVGGDTNGDGTPPAPGDWGAVRFMGDSSNEGWGTLSFCTFRYGGNYWTGDSLYTSLFVYSANASVAMDDCTVEQSSHTGVYVKFVPGVPTIDDSHFLDNAESGLLFQGSGGLVSGCTFTGQVIGIRCINAASAVIGGSHAHANTFVGNTSYGVQNEDSSVTVDATCNDWGDPSGPSGVGPGSGDAVSAHVDYEPFVGQDGDSDGLWDVFETNTGTYVSPLDTGTDPNNPDSDGDGLTDGDEVNTHGSDPNLTDSDHDGWTDLQEVQAGTGPADPLDAPGVLSFKVDRASGSDLNLGTEAYPFATLHKAVETVNSLPNGDYAIEIAAGTYSVSSGEADAPLTLDHDVSIQGAGAGATLLEGSGAAQWVSALGVSPGSASVSVSDLTISGFRTGISITTDGACASLAGVAIDSCGTGAMLVEAYQVELDLGGSVISGCTTGVEVTAGSSGNRIRNGLVESCDFQGIRIDGWRESPDGNVIERMEVRGSGLEGVALLDGSGNRLLHSRIALNNTTGDGYGGVAVMSCCSTLNWNAILGNQCFGVYAADFLNPGPVDAGYNWWGDAGGPGGTGPGLGDAVTEGVNFEPWLTEDDPWIGEPEPLDGDGDGMDDGWETLHGVDDPSGDPDKDTWTNLQECQAKTDPNDPASRPQPGSFYVGHEGASDDNVGSPCFPLATVHAAAELVNRLPDGVYDVHLAPGVYGLDPVACDTLEPDEPLYIAQEVRMYAQGAVLDGSGGIGWTAGLTLPVGVGGISIEGVTITSFQAGIASTADGGCLELSDVVVESCGKGLQLIESYLMNVDLNNSIISGCEMGVEITAGSSNNHLRGGTIENCAAQGLRIDGWVEAPDENTVEAVRVRNNGLEGIALFDGSGHRVENCRIENNNGTRLGYGGVAVLACCSAVNWNAFEGNQCVGLYADEFLYPSPVDARYNWWNDAAGPSGAGPGSAGADAVTEGVAYDPWIGTDDPWFGMPEPADTDGDGLGDDWEASHEVTEASGDADGDGWTNLCEFQALTDPRDPLSRPALTEVYVGYEGASDDNLGSPSFPLATLHAAVDRINGFPTPVDGDRYVVQAAPLTYGVDPGASDVVEPDRPLSLEQVCLVKGGGVVLNGAGAAGWTQGLTLPVGVGPITVEGLRIEGFTAGLGLRSDGGCLEISDVVIASCDKGMELVESYLMEVDLQGSVITGCGVGVDVTAGSSNNLVKNARVEYSTAQGIRVSGCVEQPDGNAIEGVTVLNSGREGVALLGGSNHRLQECRISGNNTSLGGYGGVAVLEGCARITRNEIQDNNCTGVFADEAAEAVVEGNLVTGSEAGIELSFTSGVTVIANTVTQNTRGLVIGEGSSPAVLYNVLWGNTGDVGADLVVSGGYRTLFRNDVGATGLPSLPPGNLSLNPQFVDPAGGDFRLTATSPCVDGTGYADPGVDLDGKTRPRGATWDMGAYESEAFADVDGDTLPDWWEVEYFGAISVVDDPDGDLDGDGLTNWTEYLEGTDPTTQLAVRITAPAEDPHYTDQTQITVQGTSTGVLDSISLFNNGTVVTTLTQDLGAWSAVVPLDPEENAIVAEATDGAVTVSDEVTVIRDTQDPNVTIKHPTELTEYTTSLATISVSGICWDDSRVDSVAWTRTSGGDTASGGASGTESWTAAGIPLLQGDNLVTVLATDRFGGQASAFINISYEPETGMAYEEVDISSEGAAPEGDPLDTDGDQYLNADEEACGSDPEDPTSIPANFTGAVYPPESPKSGYLLPDCLNPDNDMDGMPDDWETEHNLNPYNSGDAFEDADGDGKTNLQEYLDGTDPNEPETVGFQLTILDGQDQDITPAWLPEYGKWVKVRATWTGSGAAPGSIDFSLKNTSAYPGRAVNDPDPGLTVTHYPPWYDYHGKDFGLLNTTPTSSDHSFDQGPVHVAASDASGETVYDVYVQCWDFGGRTRVVIEVPGNPAVKGEMWVPAGSGVNGIGSGWIHDSGLPRLEPNADIDAIIFEDPDRFSAPLGDDFTNFEEYRGITYTEAGELKHMRPNPRRKELFVRAVGFSQDYPFALGNAFQNAGIDVHDVTGWGHDVTEQYSFFVFHRAGTVQSVSGNKIVGDSTSWAKHWPKREWEFKMDADPEDAWTPITFWADQTTLYLQGDYAGGSPSGAYAIRTPPPHINVVIIRMDTVSPSPKYGQDGYINHIAAIPPNVANPPYGINYWTWDHKGFCMTNGAQDQVTMYGLPVVYKIPLDHYFGDHPYVDISAVDTTTWEIAEQADWYGHPSHFNPADLNGNRLVELPYVAHPNLVTDADEQDDNQNGYTLARVLRHTITHELGHALAGPSHSDISKCLMFTPSINWKRDDYICDQYLILMRVHNINYW